LDKWSPSLAQFPITKSISVISNVDLYSAASFVVSVWAFVVGDCMSQTDPMTGNRVEVQLPNKLYLIFFSNTERIPVMGVAQNDNKSFI
jgi:hypothetical protein